MMGRPSKLSPAQWQDVERRAAAGESIKALGKEFGVARSTISGRVSVISDKVREVAIKVAAGQSALAALPIAQQYLALSLADKLRNITASLASAAELGAATAHRLAGIAHDKVAAIDGVAPLDDKSRESLRDAAALVKLGNESAVVPLALLAANKGTVRNLNAPTDAEVTVIELVALLPDAGR